MKIPINIVLPSFFPYTKPRVFLNYQLSQAAAEANPYIQGTNEVVNSFIHQWDGNNSVTYNLMALYQNL